MPYAFKNIPTVARLALHLICAFLRSLGRLVQVSAIVGKFFSAVFDNVFDGPKSVALHHSPLFSPHTSVPGEHGSPDLWQSLSSSSIAIVA
jgi:hypothetical protein